ncbi:MAG: hypothetical protein A3C85_03785 [Candidatus Doudnabacteria bacterium RIFCSPHIGHO2_02_FULL_48_21]|nr:MAG: hypothetical protein A3K05_03280 [Candidatus Doudnabacteria bacterium RIFCSPHIGHO2_01_48_18]OGE91763.1 MAG: hypothetical protein A3F44_00125 [Candidatus Doudnabacteria bacterium RIFCSPHIGHO2_12_FULL_47_25]OGE93576.1 MAG: hypothetical protein A3C85_03785 [Candidatus Doudnabacteria bacterium RIFCSPHIGHO2_02_FULL_48_21]
MHKPNRSFAQKVFAAGLAVTTALWAFGGVLAVTAAAVEAHPAGTLVLSGSTVWHISDDGTMRQGIDSLAKFLSHRYSFANVVPANSADLALPDGGLLGWGSGVLFNDGGTVYQVSGGMKHGFTSAAAFTGLGFSFANVVNASLAGVPAGANISDASGAHKEGTFVSSAGTVWQITATGRKGIPEPGVLFSYGAGFNHVVAANAADLALASEGNSTFRTGSLVNDGGTLYAVTATAKRGFPSASCYTGFGFNFSMPVAGSTTGLTAGANYCADSGTPPSTPPPPGSTGTLMVSLASDTPPAGVAIKSAARVPFTKVQLTASGGDVIIDTWQVKRAGVSQDSSFVDVDIIDLSTNSTINESGKTFNSDHIANFTEDMTIPSGTTKYVMLAGNIAASPGAGETPVLQLSAVTVKGGSVVGSFPISGNAMTINTSITIGTATVQRGAYTNASSTTIEVGKTAYTFFSFQVQAGSTEDVEFSQIKVYQSGSASLTTDMANIKLLKDGTVLSSSGTVSGNYISFSFPVQVIPKGQTFQFQVQADVVSGSARTIKLGIWRSTDILVKGTTYGANITPTYSGTGSGSGTNVLQDNQFTISNGTLRVGRSATVGSTNIAVGSNQTLGAFEFEVKGEPIVITALTLTVSSSTSGTITEDATQAYRLVDSSGKTVAGPTDITNNALTVAWTDTFTAPVGVNHYKVVATVTTGGGWTSNDTITVSINTPASAVTAKGETTGQTITPTPSSNTAASQQTVKSASLTVTKNSTPTNKTVITNSVGVLTGSWSFDATNSGEDIRITTIAVRASTTGKLNALTLKEVASPGGTVVKALSPVNDNPTTSNDKTATSTFALSEPLIITKGTTKVIDLYSNIGSDALTGEVDAWGLTDTTSATNASVVAYGVATGNRATVTLTAHDGAVLTIAGSGTLTITEDASSPASRLVVHGTTGVSLAEVRLKASNESVDITVMKLRVADGGLDSTAAGDYTQVSKVYLKLDGAVVGSSTGYTLGAASTTLNFERGQVTVPVGDVGKKLTISADIVNLGTNEPGTSNADIAVGLNGANAFTAVGNGSNTTLGLSSKTYTDSTGSAVILHKAVPSVVIETPTNNLASTAVLHRVKVSAVGGQIGLYQLAYAVTSSGPDVIVSNYYTRLASCTGCGGVADGVQLGATDSTGTPMGALDIDIVVSAIDSTQAHGKAYLQIASGATATIDLYASVVLTTGADSVSTRLLGDAASSTLDANFSNGHRAGAFATTGLQQGNFVWSDLRSADSQSLGSGTATTSAQWFNGYYVSGLGPTATTSPVTVGE